MIEDSEILEYHDYNSVKLASLLLLDDLVKRYNSPDLYHGGVSVHIFSPTKFKDKKITHQSITPEIYKWQYGSVSFQDELNYQEKR